MLTRGYDGWMQLRVVTEETEAARGAEALSHLLAVLRSAVKLLDEIGSDIDARLIAAHCAQLERGREWPGDVIEEPPFMALKVKDDPNSETWRRDFYGGAA